ncbi:MAG TPA: UDP-N-acetylmuramate--L-alanine ligase [Anaerolineales bacterium]|nr:UDP-N-acetylmuramate--L-alanine ligase [Anaerolineales bacterium]
MAHAYFIGIGGSGLSAIARLLIEKGYQVSGSDLEFSSHAREIENLGAKVFVGHKAEQISGADFVIRSSAIPDDNEEVKAAQIAGIPVYKRSEFLGKMTAERFCVAVAGAHGKTTTTAMISWMLTALDQDPSYIIGGVSKNLAKNAHAGRGSTFVVEADEYDYMFLGLHPQIAAVTNIEYDHPDCFPTEKDFFAAFVDFVKQIPEDGILLACTDDTKAAELLDLAKLNFKIDTRSYGLENREDGISPDYAVRNLSLNQLGSYNFEIYHDQGTLAEISLQIPGIHNVRNAAACLAVAHLLDLPLENAARALGEFQGTERRFEILAEVSGIAVIDDYAHHPTEIRATLGAARNRYPDRELWAVWQPHTYSRTETLFDEYLTAFSEADHVLVTEVYASREPVRDDFSALQVVESMQHPDASFLASNTQVADYLIANLKPGDVVLVLSAGDANQISAQVVEKLSLNGNG